MWLVCFLIMSARPWERAQGTRPVTLQGRSLVGIDLSHIQGGAIHLFILGVRDGAVEQLLNLGRGALGRIHEDCQRIVNLLAADQIDNDLRLAGRNADVLGGGVRALVGIGLTRGSLLFNTSCHIYLSPYLRDDAFSPAWPRKVRVGANSPNLCPTISSVT